jgi:hypothetical protein
LGSIIVPLLPKMSSVSVKLLISYTKHVICNDKHIAFFNSQVNLLSFLFIYMVHKGGLARANVLVCMSCRCLGLDLQAFVCAYPWGEWIVVVGFYRFKTYKRTLLAFRCTCVVVTWEESVKSWDALSLLIMVWQMSRQQRFQLNLLIYRYTVEIAHVIGWMSPDRIQQQASVICPSHVFNILWQIIQESHRNFIENRSISQKKRRNREKIPQSKWAQRLVVFSFLWDITKIVAFLYRCLVISSK